jgi:oxygen-independent coproporphyrinogen-3 oxidase
VTEAILERYNVPGPRYTSYPTAPEWVDSFGPNDFERALTKSNAQRPSPPLSIYIHLPFCESLCLFCGCNVDLIYGLPHQTPESFVDSIEKVIGLNPDRVAMFSYAHVPWLKKQQGSFARHVPQGMDKFRIFRAGIERFTRAGYLCIGMDHFARPDDEICVAQHGRTLHRNFQGYTTKAGADLFGVGVSSISGLDRIRAQNFRVLKDYYGAIEQNRDPLRGCLV